MFFFLCWLINFKPFFFCSTPTNKKKTHGKEIQSLFCVAIRMSICIYMHINVYIKKTRPSTSIEFHFEPNFFVVHAMYQKKEELLQAQCPPKRIFILIFLQINCHTKFTYRPIVFSTIMTIVSLTFKQNWYLVIFLLIKRKKLVG